jgi:lipid A 3-O-deacylase
MLLRLRIILATFLLTGLAGASGAQVLPPEKPQFTFHFENDVLGTDNSDRHYTGGLQFALEWKDCKSAARRRLALGHNTFTPEDIKTADLVPDDRPYAAWLYLNYARLAYSEVALDVLEFSVGVIGPAAGGEALQKWLHRVIESPDPRGWDNQLSNEPTLQAAWSRSWPGLILVGKKIQAELSPHIGGMLGNVYTLGAVGATARLGTGLEASAGTPRIAPAPPGAGCRLAGRGPAAHIFAGVSGRAVLRNIFLDGNTFQDSHSVEREPWVGELQAGLVVSGLGARFAMTYVVRIREFTGQKEPDHFGALALTVGL